MFNIENLVGQKTFPNVVWQLGITLVSGNTLPNKFPVSTGPDQVPGITLDC